MPLPIFDFHMMMRAKLRRCANLDDHMLVFLVSWAHFYVSCKCSCSTLFAFASYILWYSFLLFVVLCNGSWFGWLGFPGPATTTIRRVIQYFYFVLLQLCLLNLQLLLAAWLTSFALSSAVLNLFSKNMRTAVENFQVLLIERNLFEKCCIMYMFLLFSSLLRR